MKKEVEFGIRVSVKDGKVAAAEIKDVGNAAVSTSNQLEQAGRTMAAGLDAGAKAARGAATATDSMVEANRAVQSSAAGASHANREHVNQVKRLEISAKQTANAVRMLPAQMTDVVTQLAGGQNPLLILIQQGGQVKDSFGGIAPMMRGIASAIGPLGLAIGGVAAVTGVLAAAYYQGSKEADGYTRALVMSGNAAGSSAGMMAAAADRIDRVVGTQSAAAETLEKMAGSGQVAAQNLEQFSIVAIRMERDVGIAVDETVGNFEKLGKSPVEASLKLNEQYRYLTASVYEQIKALDDQGRADEAAELAQKTFAEAMSQRAKQLEDNLGTIERGWRAVTGVAKEAWDAMLGIGRKATIADQLADVASQIENYNPFSFFGPNLDQLKAHQASLQELARLERQGAEATAANARQNEARIAWIKEGDKYLSKTAQMEREITKARNEGAAAGVSAAEIEDRIGQIRKKYEEKGGKSEGVGSRALADLRAQIAVQDQLTEALNRYGLEADKISAGDRKIAEIQQQLTLAQKDRIGQLTDAQLKAQLAEAQRLAAAEKRNAELTRELRLRADITAQIGKWTNASQASQDLLEEEIALFGMGAEARRIASAQIKVDADLRAFLAEQQKKGQKLLPDEIALLQLEAQARKNNIATIEGQRQALAGAEQLRQENRRLAADAIVDEQERARAILEIEADMWRERIRLAGEGTDAQRKLQEQFDQWYVNRLNQPRNDAARRFVDAINNDFREGFRNMVNDGKGVWKAASKSMATTFRTAIADALYKAFAQKFVVNVAANVIDMFGLGSSSGGLAQAAGGSAGGLAQGVNLYSMGQTLWNGFNSGFASLGNTASQVFQYGANLAGGATGAVSTGAAGTGWVSAEGGAAYLSSGASMAGTAASYLGYGGLGVMAGQAISNGYGSNASVYGGALGGAAIGAQIGSIGGPLGMMIGAIIGGVLNRAFGRKSVGSGIIGNISGDDFSGNAYEFKKGGWFSSDKTVTSDLDKEATKAFDSAIKGIYQNFSNLGEAVGAGGDLLKDYSYSFRLALRDFSDEERPKVIQAHLNRISDSMAMAFVDSFRTSVDTAAQQASRYYTNTIDGERTFDGNVASKTRAASELDPHIDDIIRLFDAQREGLKGVQDAEGKLAAFTSQIFGLGDALVENTGYLSLFDEAVDFKKLESVAKEGENVIDTFARLNTIFSATNALAEMLGQNFADAFGSGVQSTDARQRLIDQVGGFEALSSSSTFFAQNFLSEAERMAPLQKSVAEEMTRLGYASVTTHEQFKQAAQELAASGALATEAGAKTYAGLMKVQVAFDAVAEYSRRTADEVIENARRQAEETVRLQKEAAEQFLADTMSAVDAAYATLRRSVDAEREAITKQHDATMDAINGRLEGVNSSLRALNSQASMLRSAVDRMRLASNASADRASAQAQIIAARDMMRATGVLPDSQALSTALDVVAQPAENLFESFVDYQRDFLKTRISIAELGRLTDTQLSVEERTLQSIQEQVKLEQERYDGEMTRLDGVLSYAQQQVDILNGIDNSIISVASAIAGLQIKLGSASIAQATAANASGTQADVITGVYRDILGRTPEASGATFWQQALATNDKYKTGESSFVRDFIEGAVNTGGMDASRAIAYARANGIPGFASGGFHTGGIALVGERGPEFINTGPARIFNAADTARILRGGHTNNDGLIAEFRLLRISVDKLLADRGGILDSIRTIARVLYGPSPILVQLASS